MLLLCAQDAEAGLREARALIRSGEFDQALEELAPALRSGNADAEEIMAVLYGWGLGVEPDEVRAFEWHQRAALKGHAGAQMSLGWCHERGLGLKQADPLRAFVWYRLAAIGGLAEAQQAADRIGGSLSEDDLGKAHDLIEDYRLWLYPLR